MGRYASARSIAFNLLARTTGIRYFVAVQYEWDDGKAAENHRKHGVDFADAIVALEDANRLEEIDARFEYGEDRIQVVGMARSGVLLVIAPLAGRGICKYYGPRN